MTDQYGVLGIGNAIVDVISQVDESFLEKHEMVKSSMALIEQDTAERIYNDLSTSTRTPGGSAGNTMACFTSFGGNGAYIGKTGKDALGEEFTTGMNDQNMTFTTQPINNDTPTARCMILVTPDAERTMNTYLGAAGFVGPDDIDEDLIKNAKITYMEGYLFDREESKQAFYKAAKLAKKHGNLVSLTLSDTFCVERYRAEFFDLVQDHIDILFSNEDEILALYETDNLEIATKQLLKDVKIGIITRSEKGSIITTEREAINIDAIPPAQLIDTTGAGDAYAAGFLYGYTEGKPLAECGRLGSLAASEVISHIGPRPEKNLAEPSKAA
ncbi:MAG: adenosine kinase [Alphaproteobacteria bacterium]|nr:adenosine kinase [Alphaproteobacteria bacterium]